MVELADYRGELEEVYGLWLGVSERVPYTEKLDSVGFEVAETVPSLILRLD